MKDNSMHSINDYGEPMHSWACTQLGILGRTTWKCERTVSCGGKRRGTSLKRMNMCRSAFEIRWPKVVIHYGSTCSIILKHIPTLMNIGLRLPRADAYTSTRSIQEQINLRRIPKTTSFCRSFKTLKSTKSAKRSAC